MYKYISTLEQLAPRFGSETFQVTSLKLREDGDGSSSYSSTVHGNGLSKENLSPLVTHEVMVSGTEGVKWRKLQIQRVSQIHFSCFLLFLLCKVFYLHILFLI